MTKRIDFRVLKAGAEFGRKDDGAGTIWGLYTGGTPLIGSANSDYIFGLSAGTIDGLGGDDLILGDMGIFQSITGQSIPGGGHNFGSATDLDGSDSNWTTDENPLFADDSVPHTTVHVQPVAATFIYFKVLIGAGQTLTIDIDAGGRSFGSAVNTNTVVELYDLSTSSDPLMELNDSPVNAGGYGSAPDFGIGNPDTVDSFLVFTNSGGAKTYYIRIYELFDGSYLHFEADDDFLVNVSLTGHAVGPATAQNDDSISGGEGNDHIFGAGGDDILDGGPGADLMAGGSGGDTYFAGESGDRADEAAGEGSDRVYASASFALIGDSEVELLETISQASGTPIDLTGSSIANTIVGNNGVNILRGQGGNDSLFGHGGQDFLVGGVGADIMVGGTGDDVYYIDDTSDAIGEQTGEGFDRVAARITLALAADADIERLDVEDLTSTNALDLTGSGIGNVIYGNDGQNILRGEAGNDELRGFGGNDFLVGGPGTDLMVGGAGDDTFYVDDASDAIGEIAGEGNDRIAASVSFVLSNGASVEVLEAVNVTAADPFDLTGSDSDNTITGNNGVNILRGEGGGDTLFGAGGDDFLVGGSGGDFMHGGAGNDTYYADEAFDVIFEEAGEGGDDRVVAASSFALFAVNDVERLEAVTQSATNAMDLAGSSIGNLILGNDGANVIDGKLGNDTLTGFGGADRFAFTTGLGASNVDTIIGFLSGSDKILLSRFVFAALDPGVPDPSMFRIDSAAQDANDRILYNSQTGQLYYDADGNGGGAAVLFAILQGAPALAASDITVI